MRLFSWGRSPKPDDLSTLAPDAPFVAIGDLHGCDHLFARLLTKLESAAAEADTLVCVGDYVDRGEDSAPLLDRLRGLQADLGEDRFVCLRGNHEEMMLGFLDDPVGLGPRWVRNGGLQTLSSFRCPAPTESSPESWETTRDRFAAALGSEAETWLRGLPTMWRTGNVAVVHAGADPLAPIEAQPEDVLLWGHPDFESRRRKDGVWVVHGHTITTDPRAAGGRIPTDTGAYATGRLTGAVVKPGSVEYVHT
ncbi:metallophosphoesterase family protein [Roseivivax sediminis]|nr:metallophosphoesterase family protein [Roseivivax sediminis]